jgi:predicted metal-dependent enzyme (double-stranded beta helix superfamily)
MELSLDQPKTSVPQLLNQLIFVDNLYQKLNALDTILNAIEDTIAEALNLKRIQTELHKYIDNIEFMRQLKLYSKMCENTETCLELMGQDFLTHPEFNFSEELEEELATLNKKLNKVIGQLIKEYAKQEEIPL